MVLRWAPGALQQLDDSLIGFEGATATSRLPGRAAPGPLERGKVLLVLLVGLVVAVAVSGATFGAA